MTRLHFSFLLAIRFLEPCCCSSGYVVTVNLQELASLQIQRMETSLLRTLHLLLGASLALTQTFKGEFRS